MAPGYSFEELTNYMIYLYPKTNFVYSYESLSQKTNCNINVDEIFYSDDELNETYYSDSNFDLNEQLDNFLNITFDSNEVNISVNCYEEIEKEFILINNTGGTVSFPADTDVKVEKIECETPISMNNYPDVNKIIDCESCGKKNLCNYVKLHEEQYHGGCINDCELCRKYFYCNDVKLIHIGCTYDCSYCINSNILGRETGCDFSAPVKKIEEKVQKNIKNIKLQKNNKNTKSQKNYKNI